MTVTKLAHPCREAINTQIISHLVEEGIRRLFQGFGDIEMTVAPFFPVAITFFGARQLRPARVKQAGIAVDHACTQRRDGDVRLNGGRWRVDALCCTVNQWGVWI